MPGAWNVMLMERGDTPDVGQFSVGGEPLKWVRVSERGIQVLERGPEPVPSVAEKGALAEDIFAGVHDKELSGDDAYLSIEATPEGPAWHQGTMEQKLAYRSLSQGQPTYVVDGNELREVITDMEVESAYGVFLEEVPVGDRAVLKKPGERIGEYEGAVGPEAEEMEMQEQEGEGGVLETYGSDLSFWGGPEEEI